VEIKVGIKDDAVKNLLKDLRAKTKNLKPAMKVIGEIVRSSVIRNFQAGGRPEPWKQTKFNSILSAYLRKHKKAYTLKGKATKGFERYTSGKKTLINTALLMNSITARAYADRAVIGSNVIYSRIHQLGGMAGRGHKVKIPARPFLLVQDQDWGTIKNVLIRHLTGGASR